MLAAMVNQSKSAYRFIDIGVNLTDPIFRGVYRGKRKHDDDTDAMFARSAAAGIKSMVIIGGSLKESEHAIRLAKQHNLYATVGCHPTRSKEFDSFKQGPDAYLAALDALISKNMTGKGRVVALGECGLDYDRTHFAPVEVQKKYFRLQLSLAKKHQLPLYLHSRAAHQDFVGILREEGFGPESPIGERLGVVHSFTGTEAELNELISMGFYISINGCSLKTEANVAAAKKVPLNRLLLETDAPWCSITSTHASHKHLATIPPALKSIYSPASTQPEKFEMGKAVKGRNEPSTTAKVGWVLHQVRGIPMEELSESAYKNSVSLFKLDENLALTYQLDSGTGDSKPVAQAIPAKLSDTSEWPSLG